MKVIDKYWFTSSEGCVGIIITENHVGDRKARISRVQGNNEETDTYWYKGEQIKALEESLK